MCLPLCPCFCFGMGGAMGSRHLVALLATFVLAAPTLAQQQNVPGERFRPATTSSGIIDTEVGAIAPHLAWNVALWGGYALDSLVAYDGADRLGALVAHRVSSDLVFAIGLFDWVELGAQLPVVVFQAADPGRLPADLAGAISPFGLSDLRIAPKVRLLRASEQSVDLAIIAAVTLPTGTPPGESFVGEHQVTALPEVVVSRRFDDGALAGLTVAGNALARLRPEERVVLNTAFGHELVGRVGVGYSLRDRFQIPLELDVSSSLGTPLLAPFSPGSGTGAEVMGALKADVLRLPNAAGAGDGFIVQAFGGMGYGVLGGVGTPALRGFIGVRGEKPADIDVDDDFIADTVDRCPMVPEDKDGFQDDDGCPDDDNDQDGVNDVKDACPNDAEDQDGFEDDDGCADADNDRDSVADGNDACPNLAGPTENKGCPWPDTDKDGILDKDDACIDTAGVAALKGCPDTDSDGIADAQDACPALAGPKDPYDGCPDTDSDGITDDKDACPKEPETVNNIDDDDGCPDQGRVLVNLTKDKIEILDKVFFDSGKATIQEKSFALLDQVATVLKHHKELHHVRVEGHTDDQGKPEQNLQLSKDRSEAVKAYLVSKGVDGGRVLAEGYGSTKPADPAKTAKAREANRRVEFVIVD